MQICSETSSACLSSRGLFRESTGERFRSWSTIRRVFCISFLHLTYVVPIVVCTPLQSFMFNPSAAIETFVSNPDNNRVGMSFTSPCTGLLTHVSVNMEDASGLGLLTAIMDVYRGAGWPASAAGTGVGSSISTTIIASQLYDFELAPPVTIDTGEGLTWVVTFSSPGAAQPDVQSTANALLRQYSGGETHFATDDSVAGVADPTRSQLNFQLSMDPNGKGNDVGSNDRDGTSN